MSNAGYIRNGLLQRGMPGYVADAFIANFRDESGLNPGINEAKPLVPGSRGGFGLFQSTGPRRRALESVAADRGLPASDIDTQLDVLTAELGMPGTGLDNHSWFGSEARAAGRIFGAKDTASAAQAIVNDFLRPSPEHRRSRTARYASLTGSAASAPGATMSDATSFFPNERMPSSLDRAPSSGASPMVSNYGSLGGLGGYASVPERPAPEPGIRGFLKSDGFGDWLGAMGASLMSSPGNAPLQNMPTLLANARDNRARAEERAEDRDWRRMNFELGRQDRMQERAWALQDSEEARRNALADYRAKTDIDRAADLEDTNRTQAWLDQYEPEIGAMTRAGMPMANGVKLATERRTGAGDETYFGNPVAIQNPDGSVGYGQIGNRGSFKPIQLGDGQTFAPPTKTIETGTETILMDQAGNVISRTPTQNYQEAFDTAQGKVEGTAQGERVTGLSGVEGTAERTLETLDRLENHPGFSTAVGWQGNLPEWMVAPAGSDAAGFVSILNQVQGQGFLQAFESLKGGGQITEIEGQKATAAITRLSRSLSEAEFKQAIAELREVVNSGLDRARRGVTVSQPAGTPSAPAGSPAAVQPAASPSTPDSSSRLPLQVYDPTTGQYGSLTASPAAQNGSLRDKYGLE